MKLLISADVDDAAQHVGGIADRLNRPRPLLQRLGRELERYEADVFRTRGGGQWDRLDPATVAGKGNGRVLVGSGLLLRNLTRARVERESVVVDQGNSDYAIWLKRGRKGMPRRDPAPVPDRATIRGWGTVVLRYLVTGR